MNLGKGAVEWGKLEKELVGLEFASWTVFADETVREMVQVCIVLEM